MKCHNIILVIKALIIKKKYNDSICDIYHGNIIESKLPTKIKESGYRKTKESDHRISLQLKHQKRKI